MLRFAFSILFFILFLLGFETLGIIIFLIAALSDFLDGFIARKLKQESKLGRMMDPFADKLMILLAVLVMVKYFNFPTYGLLILSRDLISLMGSVYVPLSRKKIEFRVRFLGKATTF